jgi:hypothetical protein
MCGSIVVSKLTNLFEPLNSTAARISRDIRPALIRSAEAGVRSSARMSSRPGVPRRDRRVLTFDSLRVTSKSGWVSSDTDAHLIAMAAHITRPVSSRACARTKRRRAGFMIRSTRQTPPPCRRTALPPAGRRCGGIIPPSSKLAASCTASRLPSARGTFTSHRD